MPGPWEKYATKPWERYAAAKAPITDLPAIEVKGSAAPENQEWGHFFPSTPRAGILEVARVNRPELEGVPDAVLAAAIRRQFYPSINAVDFYRQTGLADKLGYTDAIREPDPTEGMSAFDRVRAGFGRAYTQLGHGLKQRATQAAAAVTGSQFLKDSADEQARAEGERRRLDAPLLRTGGGIAGTMLGVGSQFLVPGTVMRGAGLGAAFLPRTFLGNVGQGMVVGASQPTVEGESWTTNAALGGGMAAASYGAMAVPGLLARGAARLSPSVTSAMQERQAANVIQQFAADPQSLANIQPTQLVKGSMPTLAEATGDMGLAGLERTLANLPDFGPQLAQRRLANNAARVGAIRNAFNGADKDAAAAIRQQTQAAEGPVISEIKKLTGAQGGKVTQWIDRTLRSPNFRGNPEVEQSLGRVRQLVTDPLSDADRISAARGIAQDWLARPRARNDDFRHMQEARRLLWRTEGNDLTAEELAKEIGRLEPKNLSAQAALKDMQRALKVSERGKQDVASLYNARKHITQNLMPRASGEGVIALRGAVEQLDKQILDVAPSYKAYLSDYAAGMRKADQAAVGAKLLGGSNAARAADDNPVINANFLRRASDMDATTRAATGFGRARADRTLTGNQLDIVERVRRDLERQSRALNDGRAVGSNTVQNAIGGNTLQSAVGPVGAAAVEPSMGVAMLAINQLRKTYGERTMAVVQDVMLNPEKAAAILGRLPSKQRQAAMSAIQQLPRVAASLGTSASPVAIAR